MCNEINCWDCGANIVLNAEPYNLDCCPTAQSKNNKERDMYTLSNVTLQGGAVVMGQATTSLEHQQRDKLQETASTVRNKHDTDLQKHFGLSDETPPQTAKELVERIKADEWEYTHEYVVNGEDEAARYHSMTYGLRWRKPDTKYDYDGYQTAYKLLGKAYTHVKQDLWVLPLTDALASVRAFEDKKFH